MKDDGNSHINRERRAGVLLHITSLPGKYGSGDMGHQAYRFIEFLHSLNFKVWQVLPLGPPHEDKSPYQCLSTHAGNPQLISIDWLVDRGWLDSGEITRKKTTTQFRKDCLKLAAEKFYTLHSQEWIKKLKAFKKQHAYWLDDYASFIACKEVNDNKPWYQWPSDYRHRETKAMEKFVSKHRRRIDEVIFEQFVFFTQWHEIRDYAKQHQVEIFGDLPIFVARDSADVWADRKNFLMDIDGVMPFVSGVPPDAFSDTGQRWGNPLYDWEYMGKSQFEWWENRFRSQLELYDLLRLDHFRGLQACWHIPDNEETAINGAWVEVPGDVLLSKLFKTFESLPLIAEDLGVITDEVIALKDSFQLPGMKVLQFAFDGNNRNPHLPHNHLPGDVIYTGTHDNDTTLGWYQNKHNYNHTFFCDYLAAEITEANQAVLSMIRSAMSSVSFLAIIPLQDLLLLDSKSRMNMPGTTENNWNWRFDWDQIRPEFNQKVQSLIHLYQRS